MGRVELTAELPLAEVLFDFYDRLKTVTQGYGSFDYEMLDYRETDLVKVDILVNGSLLATGEVVVVDERFAVRITKLLGRADNLKPAP